MRGIFGETCDTSFEVREEIITPEMTGPEPVGQIDHFCCAAPKSKTDLFLRDFRIVEETGR